MSNFSYTENPGYFDLIQDMYLGARWHYRAENWGNYTFPSGFIADFRHYYYFSPYETLPILFWSIAFTIIRYIFELFICKPLINYLKITSPSDREKFPESFWKFFAYSFFWGYCTYLLLLSGRHDYFTNTFAIWDGS